MAGSAGGTAQWSFFKNAYEATLTNSYWGTIEDLHEVVELYRSGLITPDVERFTMDDALEAYRRLCDGELDARAVVVPPFVGAPTLRGGERLPDPRADCARLPPVKETTIANYSRDPVPPASNSPATKPRNAARCTASPISHRRAEQR